MSKKLTKVFPKVKDRPKTVEEKKERLQVINPVLKDLIEKFDLETEL